MATCKDCFHYEPCFSGGESMWNNIEQTPEDCCQHFIPTANVVEVVRCKDCKHKVDALGRTMCSRTAVKKGNGWFGLTAKGENHYCSYGELKEREGK